MNNGKIISVTASNPGITLTLENTGVFLGIVVSACIISGFAIKIIGNINKISYSISQIEEDLKTHSSNAIKISELDKRFDLHIQEYINRKDVVQMVLGQLNEKIDHKFKRNLFYIRDVQRFLQRDTNFVIREYEEHSSEIE